MKGTVLAIATTLLFIGSTLSAQKTVYLDKYNKWTSNKKKAVEYAVITEEAKEQIKVERFTLAGRLEGVSYYSEYGKEPRVRVRNGHSTYLYANGKDSLVNNFKENRLAGQSIAYYPDGATQMIAIYKNGKRDGKLVGYYPDGKLRREELYQEGECVSGKLLATDGSELPFEPYYVMPEFPGGQMALAGVLAKEMKYPPDAIKEKIEGRVLVQFVVDKEGKMVDPEIISYTHPSLNSEAMRIIAAMSRFYQWTPGKIDGEVKRVKYTVPFMFRLR